MSKGGVGGGDGVGVRVQKADEMRKKDHEGDGIATKGIASAVCAEEEGSTSGTAPS